MARHVCPFWIGYLLASPLRRWAQDPDRLLSPHVRPGMTVLDVGCAMGFFSLPLARLVGPGGRVVCVDVQERMLRALAKRAARAALSERLEPRTCAPDTLGLGDREGTFDFALAFAVVHEVRSPERLFGELRRALKPAARLLLAEPAGHVRPAAFMSELDAARGQGFTVLESPPVRRSRAALLRAPGPQS
jgi:SAM-dependent methyltransferase